MRTSVLGLATLVATLAITLGSAGAFANSYTASIEGCKQAIGERLGLSNTPTNYNIDKVKSRNQYRDLNFSVSVYDRTNPIQGVDASCRVTRSGDVLAIEFDENTLPVSVAAQ
ncbi:MAG: hypothetical protein E2O58_13505 [Gammaproteobacteria bacterium]|nr:MAG: hypothetical protein E2O58_13505 [Gammaproteobacteria bacterium]